MGARQGGNVGWEKGKLTGPDALSSLPTPKPLEGDSGRFVPGAGSRHVLFSGSRNTDFPTMSHLGPISTIPSMPALSGLRAVLAVCSWEGQFISTLFLWL